MEKVKFKNIWTIIAGALLIMSIVTSVIMLDGRWYNIPLLEVQAKELDDFQIEVADGFKQIQNQWHDNWLQNRLSTLYDQLRQAEFDLRKSPNSSTIKDRIKWLEAEIRTVRKTIADRKIR